MRRFVYRLPFRPLGIPLDLDITLLLVLPLVAWAVARHVAAYAALFGIEGDLRFLERGLTPYALGLAAALLLLASIVLHELGHAFVARRFGGSVRRITLWVLGGVAELERVPRRPAVEAAVALAGPAVSIALAVAANLLRHAVPADLVLVRFVLAHAAWTNAVLATFNLLPALPMDGGRLLRALLATRLSYAAATEAAAAVSRFLAVGLGLLGLLAGNLILVLIAVFLYMAVAVEAEMAVAGDVLAGLTVGDLMTREVVSVSPDLPVGDLLAKMLRERRLAYPVVLPPQGELVGFVTLAMLEGVPGDADVAAVMARDAPTVRGDASAFEALERLADGRFGRLVVVDEAGGIAGLVSKTDILRAARVRLAGRRLGPRQGDASWPPDGSSSTSRPARRSSGGRAPSPMPSA